MTVQQIAKPPPRIVLDTNVLYAGLYSASGMSYQLLGAIAVGQVRIVTFNAKDFRPAERFGIDVITPKTLLLELV